MESPKINGGDFTLTSPHEANVYEVDAPLQPQVDKTDTASTHPGVDSEQAKALAHTKERLGLLIESAHSYPRNSIGLLDGRFGHYDSTKDSQDTYAGISAWAAAFTAMSTIKPLGLVDLEHAALTAAVVVPIVSESWLGPTWRKNMKEELGLPLLRQFHQNIQFSVIPEAVRPTAKGSETIFIDTQISQLHRTTRAEQKNFITKVARVVEGIDDAHISVPASVKPFLDLPEHIVPVPAKAFYKQLTGVDVKKIGNLKVSDNDYRLNMTVPEFMAASENVRAEAGEHLEAAAPQLIKRLLLSIQSEYPNTRTGQAIETYFANPDTKPELLIKLRNLLNLTLKRQSEPFREREVSITEHDMDIIHHRGQATPVYYPANGSAARITTRNHRYEPIGTESPEQFLGRSLKDIDEDAPLVARLITVLELVGAEDDNMDDGHNDTSRLASSEADPAEDKNPKSLITFSEHIDEEPYRRARLRVAVGKAVATGALVLAILKGGELINLIKVEGESAQDGPSSKDIADRLDREKFGVGPTNPPANVPEWKLDGIGGMSTEGYFGQFSSNEYADGAWTSSGLWENDVNLRETQFLNNKFPRIHVEGQFSNDPGKYRLIAIPYQQFTEPVNLRITTADGETVLSYTVAKSFLDAYFISLYDAPEWIKVDYDLVENKDSYLKASAAMQGAGEVLIDVPAVRRIPVRQDFSVVDLAESISTQFKYKKADSTFNTGGKTPAQFVNEVVRARVANCNIATTVIALALQQMDTIRGWTEYDYAVVAGYVNYDLPGPGNTAKYLQAKERHAYLTLGNGDVLDGTPSQLAKGEAADVDDSIEKLDSVWKKNVDDRITQAKQEKQVKAENNSKAKQTTAMIAGLAAIGAYAGYRRKKHVDRVKTQPGTAAAATDFLTWLQYTKNPHNEKYQYFKNGRRFDGNSITKLASELSVSSVIKDYLDSPKYFENNQLSKDQVYLARYLAMQIAYPSQYAEATTTAQLATT